MSGPGSAALRAFARGDGGNVRGVEAPYAPSALSRFSATLSMKPSVVSQP